MLFECRLTRRRLNNKWRLPLRLKYYIEELHKHNAQKHNAQKHNNYDLRSRSMWLDVVGVECCCWSYTISHKYCSRSRCVLWLCLYGGTLRAVYDCVVWFVVWLVFNAYGSRIHYVVPRWLVPCCTSKQARTAAASADVDGVWNETRYMETRLAWAERSVWLEAAARQRDELCVVRYTTMRASVCGVACMYAPVSKIPHMYIRNMCLYMLKYIRERKYTVIQRLQGAWERVVLYL